MRVVSYKRYEIDFYGTGSRICKEYFYFEDKNVIFYCADRTNSIEAIIFPSDENSEIFNEARSIAESIELGTLEKIPIVNGVFFYDLTETTDYEFSIEAEEILNTLESKSKQSNS